MNKTRYDETQLKSHPRRNRKQNELVKTMLKQFDLMLGENHAGELLAVFVDLLKRAVNETPDGRLELRSVEVILNDYFHAKNLADDAQFKIDEDHKKLRAFEIINEKEVDLGSLLFYIRSSNHPLAFYNKGVANEKKKLTKDEFDILKEVMK